MPTVAEYQTIALELELMFFGMGVVLCAAAVKTLLHNARQHHGSLNVPVLVVLLTMFGIALTRVIIGLIRFHIGVFKQDDETLVQYFGDINQTLRVTQTALILAQQTLGDSFLSYRLWLTYNKDWRTLPLSVLLIIGILAGSIGATYQQAVDGNPRTFAPLFKKWITAVNVMTIVVNVISSGAIAYRIWSIGRDAAKSYRGTIAIIIESGALYAVTITLTTILLQAGSDAYICLLYTVPQTIVCVFSGTIIQVSRNARRRAQTGNRTDAYTGASIPRCEPIPLSLRPGEESTMHTAGGDAYAYRIEKKHGGGHSHV